MTFKDTYGKPEPQPFNPFDGLPPELRRELFDAVAERNRAVELEREAAAIRSNVDRTMYRLRAQGVSMRRLAVAFGLSRARIQQITEQLVPTGRRRPWARFAAGPAREEPAWTPAGPAPGTGTPDTGTEEE